MQNTGRSSPFPSSGGAVPHGSPARRQFNQKEEEALIRSTVAEGPPGPSSETVLNGFQAQRFPATQSSVKNGSSYNGKYVPPPSPSQLMDAQAAGRVVPARVRASPDSMLSASIGTGMYSAAASGTTSGRPPSAPQYGRRSTSALGGEASSSANAIPSLTAFEQEIFNIGRLNKVIPDKGDSRSSSSLGGGGGPTGRTPLPALARSPTPNGGPSSTFHTNKTNISSIAMPSSQSATPSPWASASYAGKKGVQRNVPLRSVQPSPALHAEDGPQIVSAPSYLSYDDQALIANLTLTGNNSASLKNFDANATSYDGTTSGAAKSSGYYYQGESPVDEEEAHPNRTATNMPIHVPYAPDIRPQVGGMRTQAPRQPLVLRDYQMIAEACQRASRVRIEGAAYYKIGELLSKNKRDTLHKSIPYFKKYLNISRRLQDLQGECKALNVLGCTYYSCMNHEKEFGGSMVKADILRTALEYHQEHAAVADAAGIFIAQSNMGLCYRALGDLQKASECYKSAMQFAVRSGDRVAEALALSNLSDVGTLQGDIQTAQVCVERNLEIAAATKDSRVGCESYEQLGTLAMLKGDYAAATEGFLTGLEVALVEGDTEKAAELRCKIGLVQSKMRMQEQMAQAIRRMTPQ